MRFVRALFGRDAETPASSAAHEAAGSAESPPQELAKPMSADIAWPDGGDGCGKVLVAGHSHISAISHTAGVGDLAIVTNAEDPELHFLIGPWPRGDAYWDAFVRLTAGGATAVLIWGGNEYTDEFLVQPEQPFDFFSSAFPDLPTDTSVALVPEALVREYFLTPGRLPLLKSVLVRLREQGTRTVLLGTPPPKGDGPDADALFRAEIVYQRHFASLGLDPGKLKLLAGRLQAKMWGLQQQIVAEIAREGGADFLPVPPEAVNAEHLLAREYWWPDLTHANPAYGALVRQRVKEFLKQPAREASHAE